MSTNIGLCDTMRRECRRLVSRKIYIFAMVLVPVLSALFFLTLQSEGLPLKAPTSVIDMDHSRLSHNFVRSMQANELVNITSESLSFHDAMDKLQRGEIFGFYVIPQNFEKDVIGGRDCTLSYYTNITFYVPGSLVLNGFTRMSVTENGEIASGKLASKGISDRLTTVLLNPVDVQVNTIGNPWLNYSVYLSNSFIPCLLQLMIMIMTVFSVVSEIKHGTSPEWMRTARGSLFIALLGKFIPQTILFTAVGYLIDAMLYGYWQFPVGHLGNMLLAMPLFVIASQSLGLIFVSAVPNPRLALSMASLIGILAFSVAGFSYPVASMYGAIGIFSYILPIRWYFLIYIDQALNGIPLYFSRLYYAALLIFPLVVPAVAWHLRRALLRPVYVP